MRLPPSPGVKQSQVRSWRRQLEAGCEGGVWGLYPIGFPGRYDRSGILQHLPPPATGSPPRARSPSASTMRI